MTLPVTDITHVIQTSVAPVFLLMAVGSILNVLTGRLARVADRARTLALSVPHAEPAVQAQLRADLIALSRRARLVNLAITLAVMCALFVCAVIVLLFVSAVLQVDSSGPIALLFVLSMGAFIAALAAFLRETYLATAGLRFGRSL